MHHFFLVHTPFLSKPQEYTSALHTQKKTKSQLKLTISAIMHVNVYPTISDFFFKFQPLFLLTKKKKLFFPLFCCYNKNMKSALSLETVATCSTTKARVNKLILPHGLVDTPVFMPVGTQGSLKGFTPKAIEDMNCQIMLNNTYHLVSYFLIYFTVQPFIYFSYRA